MMKKIAILLLACSVLPVQAQYVCVEHRNVSHTEKLLQEAKLLYDERCYDMAEELLGQMQREKVNNVQKHEAMLLQALIAYQKNPAEALVVIDEYLKQYPDAPEQGRMRALAVMSLYAQENYAQVVNGMQEVDPDILSEEERDNVILVYAMSMIEVERYEDAAVQLDILKLISDRYDDEAVFYTAYTDYMGKRYETAEEGFTRALNTEEMPLMMKPSVAPK